MTALHRGNCVPKMLMLGGRPKRARNGQRDSIDRRGVGVFDPGTVEELSKSRIQAAASADAQGHGDSCLYRCIGRPLRSVRYPLR